MGVNPWISKLAFDRDLVGFEVHARDAELGRVVGQGHHDDVGYLIVEKKRMGRPDQKLILPGGMLTGIDFDNRRVDLDHTRKEVLDVSFNPAGSSIRRSTALTDTPGESFS